MIDSVRNADAFYWYRGTKIPLRESRTFVALRWFGDARINVGQAARAPRHGSERPMYLSRVRTMLVPRRMSSGLASALGEAREWPVYERFDGTQIVPDDVVTLTLPEGSDAKARDLARTYKAEIVAVPTPLYPHYRFRAHDGDAVALADRLVVREGLPAQPGFTVLLARRFACISSRARSTQHAANWAHEKTCVPRAWAIQRGSPSVVTAVIDSGVDLQHRDLKPNLVGGYDAYQKDEVPEPGLSSVVDQAHGTACAGIVAAKGNNTLGIIGVAPDSRIAPYRMGDFKVDYIDVTPEMLAYCIRHAADSGAAILANSYGMVEDGYDDVARAVEYAVKVKRCLFVAAAGNNDGAVMFPANAPHAMAIAATNTKDERCGELDWVPGAGSAKGPQISVGAPGVHIWTTDLRGPAGYNPGDDPKEAPPLIDEDYTLTFAGTSAACPFVAGIAALVRSQAPKLGPEEVRGIIEETAEKVGREDWGTGRNNALGHGRVNALAAVEMAARMGG